MLGAASVPRLRVYVAEVIVLSVQPAKDAFAFRVSLELTAIAPVYTVEEPLGSVPSVV
jgi:hypothetical protein